MGNYFTNPVRHPEDVGNGNIRRTVSWNSPGVMTAPGTPIGALEAGSVVLAVHAYVETAFDGTTPVVKLGSAASPEGLALGATVAAGATGVKLNLTAGVLVGIPLAADTIFYALFSVASGTPSTGKALFIVEFVNKREVEGIPFPAN